MIRFRPLEVALCLSLLAVLGTSAAAAPPSAGHSDAETIFRFNIPAGPLDAALAAFESGHRGDDRRAACARADRPGASFAGPRRRLSDTEQALELLLAGTGLSSRLAAANTYAIDVRPVSESVEVRATLPDASTTSLTATRTLTPLSDVPQSVTVITHTMIADQRMQSMADVVRYVPGVGIGQGEGNRDTPILRGNSTTADFFVDGVRDDVQYFRDLYNVEQVEAVKGPNAMIFGRGGVGGVINRATRQADWNTATRSRCRPGRTRIAASHSISIGR